MAVLALRLHPPVPINTRLCVEDTVLPLGGGRFGSEPIFVPKGHIVVYMVHAMHRRKEYYGADAEEFRPSRWENARHSWVCLRF
jgi:cytochrome P450